MEKTGGDTSCVSCAYGPMANMLAGPPGEYMLAETEVKERKPPGEWVADGGSDWRKDAGDEGGAMNGSIIDGGCDMFVVVGGSVLEEFERWSLRSSMQWWLK